MIFMKYIIIVTLILLGCEESNVNWSPCTTIHNQVNILPIYIDSNCHNKEKENIYIAVNNINEMSNSLICQNILKIENEIEINHDIQDLSGNKLACYNIEPEWYQNSKFVDYLGYGSRNKWVRLFIFNSPYMHKDGSLVLVMHELGHYIGLKHSNNEHAVMQHNININNTELTQDDGRLFCEVYDCIN